jgi:hypothetical protein
MPKQTVTLETVVTQSPELVGSTVGGQVALMSIANGAYYGLDPVASRIWELIVKPLSGATLCEQLLLEYKVSRSECEGQVLGFLQKLADANLLRIIHEPTA